MKRPWLAATLACILLGGFHDDVAAQGGILEFLHKLSGPEFLGAGITLPYPLSDTRSFRARLSLIHHWSINEEGEVAPVTDITMNTIQLTGEFLIDRLDINAGVAMHRFAADEFEDFWHPSFPVQLAVRPFRRGLCAARDLCLVPRLGAGFHVFPGFADSDFTPLNVDVSRDDPELVGNLFIAVDLRY